MAVTPRKTTRRARALRHEKTSAEARLWSRLRNRCMAGYKFARQEPLGPFIVDFLCRDAMLAVEVDGATHSTEAEVSNDKRRELYLARLGFEILRINNEDVYQRLDDVLETILARLEGRT